MEIMELILGLEIGIVIGFVLRGKVHNLDFKLKDIGSRHGKK